MPTDRAHLAEFCQNTLDDVYRYALRLCGGDSHRTADLVQDTYATLLRHVESHPDDEIGIGWLMTCCRHRHLDGLRRHRRRTRNEQRAWRRDPVRPVEDVLDGRGDHVEVIDALGRVGDPGRTALVLRHVDGLPVAEVASALGRSLAATDSLLRRARVRFQEELGSTIGGAAS